LQAILLGFQMMPVLIWYQKVMEIFTFPTIMKAR